MLKSLPSLLVCLGSLFLLGCVEESVVVKVNRDGSGVVHVRSYRQKPEIGLRFGNSKQEAVADNDDETDALPSQEKLQAVAAKLGNGVRLKSIEKKTNPQGWEGFEAVFAFDDVNELVLNEGLFGLGRESKTDDDDQAKEGDDDSADQQENPMSLASGTRFQLQGDQLVIINKSIPQFDDDAPVPSSEPTKDPFAESPKSPGKISITGSSVEKIMSQALKDARMGLFVELEGGIGETNSRFHTEDQVTLFKIQIGQLLEQKQEVEKLSRLKTQFQGAELRRETQELSDQINGIDLDLSEQIRVQFASE